MKSTHLPKFEGKNSNFKKSKIGVAGDFDSKNVNIHQSVNVGISGKKAGSKIISQLSLILGKFLFCLFMKYFFKIYFYSYFFIYY